MYKIVKFKDQYRFLSNFWVEPFKINNLYYPSVEHYYQSSKTLDKTYSEIIRKLKYPSQTKRMGSKRGININGDIYKIELRKDWELIKDKIMFTGLLYKFEIPKLKDLLLSTDDALLIEGNIWHDNYWGYCICNKCRYIPKQNHLGKLLMYVRYIKRIQKGEK